MWRAAGIVVRSTLFFLVSSLCSASNVFLATKDNLGLLNAGTVVQHRGMANLALHAASLRNFTAALSFLDKQGPENGACMPVCSWRCSNPTCSETCEPECDAPRCDTRCDDITITKDTPGCAFNCAQPSCAVVCPEAGCAGGTCPKCNAVCDDPKCKLECSTLQKCREVCEEPTCRWKCKKPDVCPEPQCSMSCETPKTCPDLSATSHLALPPPGKDEMVVRSFDMPSQEGGDSGSVTVKVRTIKDLGPPKAPMPPRGMDARTYARQQQALRAGAPAAAPGAFPFPGAPGAFPFPGAAPAAAFGGFGGVGAPGLYPGLGAPGFAGTTTLNPALLALATTTPLVLATTTTAGIPTTSTFASTTTPFFVR